MVSEYVLYPDGRPAPDVPQTKLDELCAQYGQSNVENAFTFLDSLTDGMGLLRVEPVTLERLTKVLEATR